MSRRKKAYLPDTMHVYARCEEVDDMHIKLMIHNLEVTLYHNRSGEFDGVHIYYVPPFRPKGSMSLMEQTMFALSQLPWAITGEDANLGYRGFLTWIRIAMDGCYVVDNRN